MFHWIDLLIIGSYFALLLGLGLWGLRAHQSDTESSFLYSSRKLTLPVFVMTLVATWYGLILGVGEMIYYYGVAAWVVNGLFYYGVYFLFTRYFAKKIQDGSDGTLSELFTRHYGKMIGGCVAVLTAIMSNPAAYILSLVLVIYFFLEQYQIVMDQYILVLCITIFSVLYILFQGFKAVMRTDILQFILLFFGFISLLVGSIYTFGGLDFILDQAHISSETHFSLPGAMGWQMLIVWGMLALWTFVDPNFYHRCFSLSKKVNVKKGLYWAIFFWFLFDTLTLITGFYALSVFPHVNPAMGYLELANSVLPVFLKGIFFVALLAIIMSTIDSFLFTSGMILGKGVLAPLFPHQTVKTLTKWGIVLTAILSLVLIFTIESVIGIIYAVGTVGVALLLPPLCFIFFTAHPPHKTVLMASLFTTALLLTWWIFSGWMSLDEYGFPQYFYGIEPMYPGILLNTFILFFSVIVRKK